MEILLLRGGGWGGADGVAAGSHAAWAAALLLRGGSGSQASPCIGRLRRLPAKSCCLLTHDLSILMILSSALPFPSPSPAPPAPRQAGSLIVDALRTYRHPVTVYLPPGCELRGGAWVVIDSQINPDQVELYADPSAQGGVLEPQGVVEIKFRGPELVATMHRIDPVIAGLKVR